MTISEKKMQIVMNNYFKAKCNVNTSIRDAFEKGFRIGVQKGYETAKPAEITLESAIDYLQSTGWLQEHDRILTESVKPERKKGKWVLWNEPGCEYAKCTACGEMYDQDDLYIGGNDYPKFCPNCGAKME